MEPGSEYFQKVFFSGSSGDDEDAFMIELGWMDESGEIPDVETVLVYECPGCGQEIMRPLFVNLHENAVRKQWPDCRQHITVAPASAFAVKCPTCGHILWLNELKKIGAILPASLPEHPAARGYESLNRDDFAFLLPLVSGTGEKELWVRLNLWWAANDRREHDPGPLTPEEIANLEAFVKLYDGSDFLQKAALRDLGRE